MGKGRQVRMALVCGLIVCASIACLAQSYTPPPPPLTTLPPCPVGKNGKPDRKQKNCDPTIYPTEKVESKGTEVTGTTAPHNASPASKTPAAQRFPFPGEQAPKAVEVPAAKAFPYPGSESGGGTDGRAGNGAASEAPTQDQDGNITGHTDVPHDPAAEKKAAATPAGKAFPYPGDNGADMPGDADVPARPEGESSSSSSSSSGGSGTDANGSEAGDAARAPGPKGEYDEDDSAPVPKVRDRKAKPARAQTNDERVDEDISVAKFYGQSGNKMGAYLRAKDAVKLEPEFAEGHFVLGQAAERLGKKDEAAAEFSQYLKLAPDGERAKAAEKALADLR